jgi:ankyrin repeat protein
MCMNVCHDLSQEGTSALVLAAEQGHPAVVQFLLNKGAKFETKHPGVSSKVPTVHT